MAKTILLLEDVEHVGRKGEIATVKSGYAFNYLIPKGFALIANKSTLRHQERLQKERQEKAIADKAHANEVAQTLNGQTIEIAVKIDAEGHLYGGVSQLNIIEHIRNTTGIELDKKMLPLKHPIKALGVFDLQLRLKEGITAGIHIKVVPAV